MCPLISSSSNPRIVAARKLRQKKHRIQQDRFLLEGLQLVARALDQRQDEAWMHHVVPAELFYCSSAFASPMAESLVERFEEAGGQIIAVSTSVLESLAAREMNQGLVATFARSSLAWTLEEAMECVDPNQSELLLLLDGVQYPGNLGTLLRTADAVGCLAIILTGASADVTDPAALRGSMGSVFAVPHVITTGLAPLREVPFRLVGADTTADESLWDGNALRESAMLCLGNEAHGLSPEVLEMLDDKIALPMQPGVDSLNVAIAGGVLMYEWRRRQTAGI